MINIWINIRNLDEKCLNLYQYVVLYLICLKSFDIIEKYVKKYSVIYKQLESLGTVKVVGPSVDDVVVSQSIIVEETVSPPVKEVIEEGDFITTFINLFPAGVRSGGKLVKSDKVGIRERLSKFTKEYPEYSRELIMEATKQYVDRKSAVAYKYMRTALYFIGKRDQGSDLAAECQHLLDTKGKGDSNNSEVFSKNI